MAAAIAQLAHGIAARNLVGVEAAAAHEYTKRQQIVSPAVPSPTPTPVVNDAAAVSTLLSAYLSANPSLHTANAEIISLVSSYARAQAAYNSALERGETPPLPVLAVPTSTGGTRFTFLPPSTTNGTTTALATGNSTTSSITNTATPIGAAVKAHLVSKMSMLGLCGLLAIFVVAV